MIAQEQKKSKFLLLVKFMLIVSNIDIASELHILGKMKSIINQKNTSN